MAFPKKDKDTYLGKKVPTGKEGTKYIDELKNIRDDLKELKEITEEIQKNKHMPIDMMKKVNTTIDKLKKDTQKLNNDFPGLGFKAES
ncbi:MAG: hypothetical protein PVI40_05345 [Chlamydiota bacterium]|jgi:hypothetical protein